MRDYPFGETYCAHQEEPHVKLLLDWEVRLNMWFGWGKGMEKI